MHSSLKHFTCLAALLLAARLPVLAKDAADKAKTADRKSADKKKKGDDKKKVDKKTDPQPDADPNAPAPADGDKTGRINLPLVEGHDSFGLKIPYTDTNGKLQMIHYIGVATRVDPDNVRMKDTKVETYNDEGEVEMTVDLPLSNLNLVNKIVTSQTETTIKREDFTVTGDSIQFNTVTKEAAMVGHVKMIVYDLNDEAGKPPTAPPSATDLKPGE